MRSTMGLFLLVLAAVLPAGCDDARPDAVPSPARVADAADPALHVARWRLPAPDGAAQPNLVAAPDGTLLLSWIEPDADGHALRFARHDARGWSTPRTIARGSDWFVNWADTPHIVATADGALWAHWLRRSGASPYAYDVVLSRSADGGATWAAPVTVNDDGTPTEHGFASLWPAGDDRIGVAWLDGRATGGGHDAHDGHGGGGMMTLRAATFDAALSRSGEARLDASTCDCCQTDIALAGGRPVLAYRDRTPGEIRDIAVARLEDDRWSAPRIVHADGWEMPACPVNGPAIAADGEALVVAWYTGAGGTPTLRLAGSRDGGRTFAAPVELDRGDALLGRADVALADGRAWVAWLREDASGQVLRLERHAMDGTGGTRATDVAVLAGRGRATGMPQLVLADARAYLAWTDIVEGVPRLRGAVVRSAREAGDHDG